MMDEYTRNFRLIETICASDAMNSARTVLEEHAETLSEEQWEGIRRFVFPVLEAESERPDGEYRRLRDSDASAFKTLSLLRDVRALSRGPHVVIARTARKAIHRATNRRIK
jgi:hypothetical protein